MPRSTFITQAVILAAGECYRFTPFNSRACHKSNFVLMGEPIINQTIKALKKSGIKKIIVVKSLDDEVIDKNLRLIDKGGLQLSVYSQKKALGAGNAILGIKKYLDDRFLLLNPQHINIDEHLSLLKKETSLTPDAIYVFSQETDEPQKYGILGLKGKRVVKVVEKPSSLSGLSGQRILGIYILNSDFVDLMRKLKTSEYQLEEALNQYAEKKDTFAIETKFSTLSLKYAWDVFPISSYKFSHFEDKPRIGKNVRIHKSAIITGPVVIEDGARVYENSIIEGPCYLGKNSLIGSFCKVRNETVLEEGAELQNNVEVKHSLIGKKTHIHSGFIGDSVIGEEGRIGAGFITANRRLDRANIEVFVKGKLVKLNTNYFGSLIGDNVKIGIHCGTNPGAVIQSNSSVLPMTIVSSQK